MRKVPEIGNPQATTRHKTAKSRLPLNRLLEAKALNGHQRKTFTRALFPKSSAN
jgi:hypothetical protein